MTRLLTLAIATLALSACASSGTQSSAPAPTPVATAPAVVAPAPAAFNPAGAYDFTTEVNGAPMKGTLTITGKPGAYGGKMTSDIMPELPINSVLVEGQTVKLLADTPQGSVTINITFVGDTFTGNWELGGQGGNLTGKRIVK